MYDERFEKAGRVLGGKLKLFGGIILLPLAVGAFLSPPPVFFAGIALLGASSALLVSGGLALRRIALPVRKAEGYAQSDEGARAEQEEPDLRGGRDGSASVFLAEWTVPAELWEAFRRSEGRRLLLEEGIAWCVTTGGGGLLLMAIRAASPALAFTVSGGFSAAVAVVRYRLKTGTLATASGRAVSVRIGEHFVSFDGTRVNLGDEVKRLSGIRIIPSEPLPLLEFRYAWNTRRGVLGDEFRLPVAIPDRASIDALVERLRACHGIGQEAPH